MVAEPEVHEHESPPRAENLARLTEKVRRLKAASTEPRTAEELVQVQYSVAQHQIDERLREALLDWKTLSATHLGVPPDEIALLFEKCRGPYVRPLLELIGDQLAAYPEVEIGGASPGNLPEWRRVERDGTTVSVPDAMTIYWDAGTAAEVPLVLAIWTNNQGERVVLVRSGLEHRAIAQAYLDGLLAEVRGSANPYRGHLLKASHDSQGGIALETFPDPSGSRDDLVLPPAIWSALDVNVHRMFERVEAFKAAGLGSNRGILLAGAPGTGKTAACRVLAKEVLGRATPIFVQAEVGQYMLGQLYAELDTFGPSLVVIEDLDLLVGDREEHTARSAVFDFLTVLDGLMTSHHDVITVATTNDPNAIDAAVRRAARFDQVVTFPLPDAAARKQILSVYLQQVDHEVDLATAAEATEGRSGADLREYVREALLRSENRVTTDDLLFSVPPDLDASPAAPESPPKTGRYL